MKSFGKCCLLGVLAGAWGCGGDSSEPHVDTGLAEATALRDVSSADSVSACENVRAAIQSEFTPEQTLHGACELFGAALADTSADCQTRTDSCVEQTQNGTNPLFNSEQLDFSAGLSCDGDVSDFEGCSVTVGEYEKCMDARLEQVKALFASFSCAQAATIETADAQNFVQQLSHPEVPPACERLQTECPEALPLMGDEN